VGHWPTKFLKQPSNDICLLLKDFYIDQQVVVHLVYRWMRRWSNQEILGDFCG
jgi:hypothetical protein